MLRAPPPVPLAGPNGQGFVRPVRLHPLTLAFDDPALEKQFVAEHDAGSLNQMRLAGALGFVLYSVYALLDRQMFPEAFGKLLIIRFAVVAPIIAVFLAVTFQPRCRPYLQAANATLMCIGGLGMVAIVLVAPPPHNFVYHEGAMLVSLYSYTFARLRIAWAASANLLVFLAYELLVRLFTDIPTGTYLMNSSLGLGANVVGISACYSLEKHLRREFLHRRDLAAEREKSEQLLLNVLPAPIARRLLAGQGAIADEFASVTVLFADIVGFTPLAATLPPTELVATLDRVFSRFDALAERHGLEKVKTIGDAYMAVAGLPYPREDHAQRAAEMALDMREALKDVSRELGLDLALRIGLHTGPVVAGVIGRRKFIYDLWGDTVNVASRMESHGVPGEVQVSAATARALVGRYVVTSRGDIEVKGRGKMPTFLLLSRAGAPLGAVDDEEERTHAARARR